MESESMWSEAMGSDTMGSYGMKSARLHTKGFTLIASLLLLLLLSGIAIGLMMMVNTEGKVGGTDMRNNTAFHAAEGGIETMYSNLALVFQTSMAPTAAQICAVSSTQPVMPGFTWTQYSVMPGTTTSTTCPSTLTATWGQITGNGPNAGLWAQIIPVNMLATASSTTGGQEVTMVRQAQVALIPVFQFGVFSESDLSFFSGPNFDMAGPVHTNGDLYPFVGPGSTLVFHNKIESYGNVVRTQLANGWNANTNYNGTVWMPTASNGCTALTAAGNCTAMSAPNAASYGDGSVEGAGGNPPVSTYNGANAWNTFSKTTTAFELINGNYGSMTNVGTGAKNLKMPFVSGTTYPFQVIRRPQVGESPTSALAQSREWNLAVIHVELSDDPAEFLNGTGIADPQNVRLANLTALQATSTGAGTTGINVGGISIAAGNYAATFAAPSSGTYNLYFAAASNAVPMAGVVTAGTSAATAGVGSAEWPYAPLPWLGNANNSSPTKTGLQPTGATGAQSAPITYNNTASVAPTLALCPPAAPTPQYTPTGCPAAPAPPYYAVAGVAAPNSSAAVAGQTQTWNLIDGYLRVEYLNNSGVWVPVTNEWLSLGFARGTAAVTQSGGGTPAASPDFTPTPNPINPNAILLLQEPADRSTIPMSASGAVPLCTANNGLTGVNQRCTAWSVTPPLLLDNPATNPYWEFGLSTLATQSVTQFNWYPINFYDAREGEVRDNAVADNSCSSNGVMNAVEIDVGNLKRWLSGAIGTSGTNVNYTNQNGYVLYFSDRRGMLLNPNPTTPDPAGVKSGDSGLEDVVNASTAAGTPDGVLEPVPAGKTFSPEDVNENGQPDFFGPLNMGLGFYGTQANPGTPGVQGKNLNTQINSTAHPDPFGTAANARIASCSNTARKNWVSGARHVLRLVDASLGNVPTAPGGTLADPGGFTVASENPVYVWGDYNTNSTDTVWNSPPVDLAGHSSAAVIADAVTFLSNQWTDQQSMLGNPGGGAGTDATVTNPGNRVATSAWYRLAVAGGKNINFPQPGWGAAQDFGTDGGVHNFLRYLENWNGSLNYTGSIVSLYYSTYNTGVYKCCNVVYNPPTRNYSFDLDFSTPAGLPPGTPMFRDVNSLGFREMLATRTD
jgi:Tfp pilus assembly protein PilX